MKGIILLCILATAALFHGSCAKSLEHAFEDNISSNNEIDIDDDDFLIRQIITKTVVNVFHYLLTLKHLFVKTLKQKLNVKNIQKKDGKWCHDGEIRLDVVDDTKYEICLNKTWASKKCPPGQIVNLSTRYNNSVTASSLKKPCGLPCENGDVQSIDAKQFKRYEVCINNVWEKRTCPDGQIFVGAVLYPGITKNSTENDTLYYDHISASNSSEKIPDNHCVDNCKDGEIVGGKIESEYLICLGYKWELRKCKKGEVFDAVDLTVGPPIRESEFDEEDDLVNTPCRKNCSDETYKSSNDGNDKYYECVSNKWIVKKCPIGQVYDTTLETKSQVRRIYRHQRRSMKTVSNKLIPCKEACTEGYVQANNKTNNASYEICVNGVWVHKTCPSGQIVAPSDHENNSTCAEYCVEGHIKASKKGKNRYYSCKGNVWREETCNSGEEYVGDDNPLEIRFDVYTDDRTRSVDPCKAISTVGPIDEACEPNSKQPFFSDNTKYYECIDSKFVVRQCSKGKTFNERKNKCSKKHH